MTYTLPPLNALRAFEAAARHLSFKLAAHELHVTPAAVGQHVRALEARLGVPLFERLHKQLILTAAGQAYLPGISDGFRRIADATSQLKPAGAVLLQLGVHGGFDLRRLSDDAAIPAPITALADKRWAAKQSKDFAAADALRKDLTAAQEQR